MSTLTERFPTSLDVDGSTVPINSDFRTVLRCFEIQGREKTLSPDDLVKMLKLLYKKHPRVFTEAYVERMFWFLECGRRSDRNRKMFPRRAAGINNKQPFDFEEDADLIYAGFMQQYGIDLQESDMHWWKFMILLENLGNDTRLSRIMEFRTIDTKQKGLSKDQRKFYEAMQRYYGLDAFRIPEMTEQDKLVEEALLNGGDVSKVLAGDKD